MAGRRKKTEQKVIPLEPIQDRCFDCTCICYPLFHQTVDLTPKFVPNIVIFAQVVWKNGRILLSNLEPSTVNLLVSHGYGKGTLSRNAPNFDKRRAEGLVGATTTNPFATPSRILNSASISSDIDETRGLLDQLSLSTRENPEEFQLGHEEALYLMHEVGAIQLRTEGDISPFDAPTLFKLLCEHQVGFPPRYFGASTHVSEQLLMGKCNLTLCPFFSLQTLSKAWLGRETWS